MSEQRGKICVKMTGGEVLSWPAADCVALVDFGVLCVKRIWAIPFGAGGSQVIFMSPQGQWETMWLEFEHGEHPDFKRTT